MTNAWPAEPVAAGRVANAHPLAAAPASRASRRGLSRDRHAGADGAGRAGCDPGPAAGRTPPGARRRLAERPRGTSGPLRCGRYAMDTARTVTEACEPADWFR